MQRKPSSAGTHCIRTERKYHIKNHTIVICGAGGISFSECLPDEDQALWVATGQGLNFLSTIIREGSPPPHIIGSQSTCKTDLEQNNLECTVY